MPYQYKLIIFIIASAGLLWLSWPSLRSIRYHGFYRFFAFESILILVLLNIDGWFHAPFSLHQIVSWLLIIICMFLLVLGIQQLRMIGRPAEVRKDPGLIGVEKTTALVTTGVYRYIRHPIYAAGLYGVWGIFFKRPSWVGALLTLLTTLFLTVTARIEETENIRFFGNDYEEYMKRTRMFIPFLF